MTDATAGLVVHDNPRERRYGALADIRERGLRVVPHCPFVPDYLRRHPDDLDLFGVDPAIPG